MGHAISGPLSLAFSSAGGHWLEDLRAVSVRSTPPAFARAGGSTSSTTSAA